MTKKMQQVAEGLEQVRALLEQGHCAKALELLRSKDRSPWAENARAVCLMRLGQPQQAVSIYRSLLLRSDVLIREDAPAVFVVNFATALLLTGNIAGAISTLEEMPQKNDPGAGRLRKAIDRWRKSLSIVERLRFFFSDELANRPVRLDFEPGKA